MSGAIPTYSAVQYTAPAAAVPVAPTAAAASVASGGGGSESALAGIYIGLADVSYSGTVLPDGEFMYLPFTETHEDSSDAYTYVTNGVRVPNTGIYRVDVQFMCVPAAVSATSRLLCQLHENGETHTSPGGEYPVLIQTLSGQRVTFTVYAKLTADDELTAYVESLIEDDCTIGAGGQTSIGMVFFVEQIA